MAKIFSRLRKIVRKEGVDPPFDGKVFSFFFKNGFLSAMRLVFLFSSDKSEESHPYSVLTESKGKDRLTKNDRKSIILTYKLSFLFVSQEKADTPPKNMR